jgi:hypothetical protein
MTARPLAALTLAPNAPAAKSASTSIPYECVQLARPSAPAASARPVAITTCSLIRSARKPQPRSVNSIPIPTAPSTTPVSPTVRP